jgi:hypothetical protein
VLKPFLTLHTTENILSKGRDCPGSQLEVGSRTIGMTSALQVKPTPVEKRISCLVLHAETVNMCVNLKLHIQEVQCLLCSLLTC